MAKAIVVDGNTILVEDWLADRLQSENAKSDPHVQRFLAFSLVDRMRSHQGE